MAQPLIEEPLTAGRLTSGVVKVGDTVRRPRKPSSPFVAKLLEHLHTQGFAGAPRYLGRDAAGRESFSYIPGEVPVSFRHFADEQVCAAATLLRAFHDATRSSSLLAGCAVICHGDPGPNNMVFREGLPVALIDFDFAAPGDPMQDLGYMAWTWCVSSRPERGPVSIQAQQIRSLADAYGLTPDRRTGIIDAILERHDWNVGFWSQGEGALAASGNTSPSRERVAEIIAWTQRESSFVGQHRAEFIAALA